MKNKPLNIKKIKKYIDNKKLKQNISDENWLEIYSANDIENATKIFIKKVTQIIEQSTNNVKIKGQHIKRHPWVTDGILKSIHKKNTNNIQINETESNETEYNKILAK